MATIQDEIFEEFCQRLEKTKEFSEARVRQVRQLFTAGKKPKPNDLVKAFSEKDVKEDVP